MSRLVDLRCFIGGLFVASGLLVTFAGLTAEAEDIARAGGVNLSLWVGPAMLLSGLAVLVWLLLRPARP